ncbi:MAG: hypothetical protein H6836_09405 [Planctomycetes bacterium]|nr:hypothetical protein [Planctomycetota bacterium]MCB9889779.1 hypothetical protein [Planctomycetota bacterium]
MHRAKALITPLMLGVALASQPPTTRPATAAQALERASTALREWAGLAAKEREKAKLKQVVDAVRAAGKPGLSFLAAQVRDHERGGRRREYDALHTVLCHVGLRMLDEVEKSEMVFAGQYAELAVLQPHIGEFFVGLVLTTPQWFPFDRRWRVVPALRDLYPKGPDTETMDKVQAMAEDELEPYHMRVRLGYALAQWGRRRMVKDQILEFQRTLGGKDPERAAVAARDLAALYYAIRDYAPAAVTHREYLRRAVEVEHPLFPVDYYNAACCAALSGDRRGGLEMLRRCIECNVSDDIDSSQRLKLKLFARDPEIAMLRAAPEFVELMRRAFGKAWDVEGGQQSGRRAPDGKAGAGGSGSQTRTKRLVPGD